MPIAFDCEAILSFNQFYTKKKFNVNTEVITFEPENQLRIQYMFYQQIKYTVNYKFQYLYFDLGKSLFRIKDLIILRRNVRNPSIQLYTRIDRLKC